MLKMRGVIALILMLFGFEALAASNTAVLPQGIWHPSMRFGYISEVSNRYDNSGSLQSVGRLNQAFSGENIGRYNSDFQDFARYLKQTFPNANYIDKISIGQLEFEANADVTYMAPVLAYGVTKRLSVGVGIPIVTLKADVRYQQTGANNARQVCNQIAQEQGSSASLDEACDKLENTNLVQKFQQALKDRGYEVPTQTDRTVVGDVQVAAIYQYWENKRWTLYEQTLLNLPTGPEDDPDDFLDIPVFHQTGLKFEFHQDYRILPRWTIGSVLAYNWKIPDTAEKRVPRDENDVLPTADRKERVQRDLGDIVTVGGTTNYWFTRVLSVNLGYDYNYKGKDVYSGDRGYDYSLMSRATEAHWNRVSAGFTVSTIDLYFAQEFPAPLQASYLYSDIISGVNVDRQMVHEMTLKMFF